MIKPGGNNWALVAVLMAALLAVDSALPVELTELSGAAHGYPALRDANGKIGRASCRERVLTGV